MPWDPRGRLRTLVRRARRLERREVRSLRRRVETTRVLVHLSILLVLPVLIAAVTLLSNAVALLSFLLFPPLAAGSYTLFAHPESRYASPRRFVGGLTAGALCGWAALSIDAMVSTGRPTGLQTTAFAAGLCIFLVAAVTWALDLEEPAAFSTALLALLVPGDAQFAYAASVFASTLLVAGAFVVWRDHFYERRAEILYETTTGDDRLLVPMRGPNPDATAMLAGRLAAAHDTGKVVLLDVVEDEAVARAEREHLERAARVASEAVESGDGREEEPDAETDDAEAAADAVTDAARTIEERADAIEREVGVPCQVVVAVDGGDLAGTIATAARNANCDVLAVPYEADDGALAAHVQSLFRTEFDVVVHRSTDGRTVWNRVLVPVRGTSDVSHAMLEFATRLVCEDEDGRVSVCHCLGSGGDRRRAEEMLADLVEPYDGHIETRVAELDIETYLAETAPDYDLVIVGASRDRSAASRLISRPTFQRIRDVDSDVAIVDRN